MEETEPLTPLHPNHVKAMRLTAIIAAVPFTIAALAAEITRLLPWGVFLVPVALVAAIIIIRIPLRRYHARGYRLAEERLQVVRGMLFRRDTVVPFGRVQHIDVDQGPIERFYGLATLTLHTAGSHNASVSLPGLAHEDALAMRDEIRAAIRRDTQ
ncbi:PH domain-containing protein [Qipengyuania marisflavi]|uniref:PH domain-containing protein n=1 Tax=Qipengyuania marisflavi TaxID=2486356 RepID=A0A5S3P539_9SPHN|nr:PH domain-containing protein [Qipengyuania marisflavi]TMM48127.1 PH domain-containing protein [Qipengyuania marisflavi]